MLTNTSQIVLRILNPRTHKHTRTVQDTLIRGIIPIEKRLTLTVPRRQPRPTHIHRILIQRTNQQTAIIPRIPPKIPPTGTHSPRPRPIHRIPNTRTVDVTGPRRRIPREITITGTLINPDWDSRPIDIRHA